VKKRKVGGRRKKKECSYCRRGYKGHTASVYCSMECRSKAMVDRYAGKRFGHLVVLEEYPDPLYRKTKTSVVPLLLVDCDLCGNRKVVSYASLIHGGSISCGCRISKNRTKIGERYGRWIVLSMVPRRDWVRNKNGSTVPMWLCRCDCGVEKRVRGVNLRSGGSQSCGCFHKEKSYETVRSRRKNKTPITTGYVRRVKDGAKGRHIEVDESIVEEEYLYGLFQRQKGRCALSGKRISLARHVKDKQTASLDRIDSAKGYVEGNVQWVDVMVNRCKRDYEEKDFIRMCKRVAKTK
jgi:hypothetical protein